MTVSPSEAEAGEQVEETAPDPLRALAERVAEAVDGTVGEAVLTAKVRVPLERWTEALRIARDDLGLVYFSFLSAIDWSNEVAVGDEPSEEVEERFELLCAVGDLDEGELVVFSTDLPKEGPAAPTLVDLYAGANWHEREAHEMFGIEFEGHPDLSHLYLPNGFAGHPLRKSFPLLSREVKPWPGKVDVEDMPEAGEEEQEATASTENPEA